MDDSEIRALSKDVTGLKKSMHEIQVKQLMNDDKLDKLTTEISNMNKKQTFFHKHYVLLIGLSTICLIVLIVLCHIHHII